MSIRAVVQKGVIVPLEPLPASWQEGTSVMAFDVDTESLKTEAEDISDFVAMMLSLPVIEFEKGEESQLDQMMLEADLQAKKLVRRDMELT